MRMNYCEWKEVGLTKYFRPFLFQRHVRVIKWPGPMARVHRSAGDRLLLWTWSLDMVQPFVSETVTRALP